MNFKKISTIALAATSMAMFSCSTSQYAQAKKWVKEHFTKLKNIETIDGVGGAEIFDFRSTTGEANKTLVKEFLKSEYPQLDQEHINNLYGSCNLQTEDKEEYYKDLEVLNENTFEKILGTEKQFNDNKISVKMEDVMFCVLYSDVEEKLGNANIGCAEIFNFEGIEIEDIYIYDITNESGTIKGYIHTIFIAPQIDN